MKKVKVIEKAEPIIVSKEDALSEPERQDLFTQLLLGQEATTEIETSRGTFTVKFPKEKDVLAIGRLMSLNRGGLPVASFDMESENRNLICSTLNIVVTGCPAWFEKAKQNKPDFSFEEVPDEQFLKELYQKAQEFRREVQESISAKRNGKSRAVSTGKSMDDPMDVGVFAGVEGATD